MDRDEPIGFEHRFEADAETATTIAREFIRYLALRPGVFALLAAGSLGLGLLAYGSIDASVKVRLLLGTLSTVAGIGGAFLITYRGTLRGLRTEMPAGAAIESGFGQDEFVFRTALSTERVKYRGVDALHLTKRAAILHYGGKLHCFPRPLFPDDSIALIRVAKAARKASN